jgi:hypothetical protein
MPTDRISDSIPKWLHDFQLGIVTQLSALEAGQTHIIARLDKINGSIGEHSRRLVAVEEHPLTCPLESRVAEVEEAIGMARVAKDSRDWEDRRWHRRISPLVAMALAFAMGLLSRSAPDIVKLVEKVFWP